MWRRIAAYFVLGGVVAMGGFGYWTWLQSMKHARGPLNGEAMLTAESAHAVFQGLAEDLPYLAWQLPDGGVRSVAATSGLLNTYQQRHPAVASFVLFSPDGKMLLNTVHPCCELLPDPRRHVAIYRSIRATLDFPGVWIGQTQKGLVLQRYRIPIRYVIRDKHGKPLSILQASVLLDDLVGQWA